jgi:KDO2-lipid IV(A) lauroyltransferase
MKLIYSLKYLIEFLFIFIFFFIYKVLGTNLSSFISKKIFKFLGPFFKPKKITESNLRRAFPKITDKEIKVYLREMWSYYGQILSEYPFLKSVRNKNFSKNIKIEGEEILKEIKTNNEKVIFVSGHFDNFELMAMTLEKYGLEVAAIYRPLNNYFLNPVMEKIRKNFICKNQIKKGRSSVRNLLKLFNNGTSIALMIDQRVSEGIKAKFFNYEAYTTTIPAQFVKKFNCRVVPIYINRTEGMNFVLKVFKPIKFNNNDSTLSITEDLNKQLEKMILINPTKWIWTHNRWK